ncbi:MAG: hypothetical protein JXB00_04900 [Bacteroidales bacterium]|nr:hypothetical protein [Bacteroidales bacterium]
MKYFISTFLLVILISGQKNETGLPEVLVENAEKYNRAFPSEHVYLITDKTFYKPGEELWFRAIAENTLNGKELGSDLNIKLLDVFGKQVLNLRYPLIDNESKGYLMLPAYLTEGKYRLIGYTGWMKNLPVNSAFCREIIISKNIDRHFNLSVSFPEYLYYPGSDIMASVKLSSPDKNPLPNTKFSFICRSQKRIIYHGRSQTDENGNCSISFELPPETDSDLLWIEFTVKHKKKSETFVELLPVRRKNIEIQFLPEGGKLIAGYENKVAFKAIDSYGFPVDIEGFLMDETGKQINRVRSSYLGLGVFTFKPGNHRYRFRIIKPVTENVFYPLPEVSSGEILLNYSGNNKEDISFLLQTADDKNLTKATIVLEQNGKIVWAAGTEFSGSQRIKAPLGLFTEGIIKCTLLDDSANIIASRNIAAPAQKPEKTLEVNLLKDTYGKKEKVFIELKNPSALNISTTISVCKSNRISSSEISLQDYLHYYIWLKEAKPAYFSQSLTDENLDLIMLTHTVKSLPLSGLYNYGYKYSLPYYNQDGITGQVVDKKNNPLENAKVKIIHTPDLRIFQASSDVRGIFNVKFDNRIINYDLLNVAIADETGRSIENYSIYDLYSENITTNSYTNKEEWQFEQLLDLIKYKNPLLLYSGKYSHGKEKRKKAYTGKGYNYKKYSLYQSVADIISEMKSYKLVNGEIVFIGHENSAGTQHGALIVVDGIALGTSADILNSISPKDIRDISISTSPADIQRYSARNSMGVIELFTLRSDESTSLGTMHEIQKDILMLDHEFYSPDYSIDNIPGFDSRTTLLWKPELNLASNSTENISFYTSDIQGSYICTFTVMDSKGNRFTKNITFTVK